MKLINKFINNIKWLLIANVYSALSKFIILILLASFTTPEEVGIYSLGLAITAPITLLFNMKMKSVIVTEENLNIDMYSRIRIIANILAFILITSVVVILYESYLIAFLLIGIMKIFDLNSEFYQSLHNRNKNFQLTSILIISKFTVVTLAFAIFLFISNSLEGALVFYIIFQLLHLIIERHYFNGYNKFNKTQGNASYKIILSFMIPLGVSQMLYSFGASIPKYYLEYFGTIEQVGIFSALLYFVTIVNLFMNSILQSILPYIRDLYFNSKSTFHKYIFIILPLMAIITGMILILPVHFFGETILLIIYGEEYSNYYQLLFILIIVIVLSIIGWAYDAALLVSRKTKLQPLLTFINIVLTLLLSMLFLKSNMLIAASILLAFYHFMNSFLKLIYYKSSSLKKRGDNTC